MKKAIALAVAMTAAAGANAAFENYPTALGSSYENVLTDLIFTAWTTTDGLDYSVNVDLDLSTLNDAGDNLRDLSSISQTWNIDLSPLGSDLSTLQWTVFANNASGPVYQVFTTANNLAYPEDGAFSGQYLTMLNFLGANEGSSNVVVGTEGQANFGAEALVDDGGFVGVGVTGELGQTLALAGFEYQSGNPGTVLNYFTFDGTTLTLSPVPVPAAAWLFGSALIGLAGVARKRKA